MILFVDGGCTNSNQKDISLRQMRMVVMTSKGDLLIDKTQEGGSNNIAELLAIKEALMWASKRKRLKELSEMSEVWNTQRYTFLRYIILVSNKRPFPFTRLEKSLSKYEHHPHSHYIKKKRR